MSSPICTRSKRKALEAGSETAEQTSGKTSERDLSPINQNPDLDTVSDDICDFDPQLSPHLLASKVQQGIPVHNMGGLGTDPTLEAGAYIANDIRMCVSNEFAEVRGLLSESLGKSSEIVRGVATQSYRNTETILEWQQGITERFDHHYKALEDVTVNYYAALERKMDSHYHSLEKLTLRISEDIQTKLETQNRVVEQTMNGVGRDIDTKMHAQNQTLRQLIHNVCCDIKEEIQNQITHQPQPDIDSILNTKLQGIEQVILRSQDELFKKIGSRQYVMEQLIEQQHSELSYSVNQLLNN